MQLEINVEDGYFPAIEDAIRKLNIPHNSINIEIIDEDIEQYRKSEKYRKDRESLHQTVQCIESGDENLTPYKEGIDKIVEKLKATHADSQNR